MSVHSQPSIRPMYPPPSSAYRAQVPPTTAYPPGMNGNVPTSAYAPSQHNQSNATMTYTLPGNSIGPIPSLTTNNINGTVQVRCFRLSFRFDRSIHI
jgi:hypothetical protein